MGCGGKAGEGEGWVGSRMEGGGGAARGGGKGGLGPDSGVLQGQVMLDGDSTAWVPQGQVMWRQYCPDGDPAPGFTCIDNARHSPSQSGWMCRVLEEKVSLTHNQRLKRCHPSGGYGDRCEIRQSSPPLSPLLSLALSPLSLSSSLSHRLFSFSSAMLFVVASPLPSSLPSLLPRV